MPLLLFIIVPAAFTLVAAADLVQRTGIKIVNNEEQTIVKLSEKVDKVLWIGDVWSWAETIFGAYSHFEAVISELVDKTVLNAGTAMTTGQQVMLASILPTKGEALSLVIVASVLFFVRMTEFAGAR